jgi:hypothetical protein
MKEGIPRSTGISLVCLVHGICHNGFFFMRLCGQDLSVAVDGGGHVDRA